MFFIIHLSLYCYYTVIDMGILISQNVPSDFYKDIIDGFIFTLIFQLCYWFDAIDIVHTRLVREFDN